ncbi:hypothetical protein GGS21DRAFT_534878 [Xylaria nigripes]|nr:hypothetical protein GGS21DRAFT_534878 [Xylaria nigripes]
MSYGAASRSVSTAVVIVFMCIIPNAYEANTGTITRVSAEVMKMSHIPYLGHLYCTYLYVGSPLYVRM